MNKVTWLHISDLHLRPLQAYDSDIVLKKLLEDVEMCIKNDSLHPDFIILSGDISYRSKPEEYELAKGFLDKLLEISGLGKDRIFIVPGNHDVDRDSITPGARVMTDGIDSRDSVNRILDNGVDRAFIFQRFINYSNFIKQYMGERTILFDNEHYYYVKHIPFDNLNLSILGLNSSWLSGSDNDQGKLVLGDMQVQKALAEVENADICIAMMHHPFDWFQKFDKSDVESSLSKKCAFVLHGHLHEQSINHISGPGRSSTVIGAGACFEKRTSFNSYNFVQLNLDDGKGRIHLRMYSDKDSGFWTNDTITYKGATNGVYEFPLPSDICKASVEEIAIELQKSKAKINSKFTRLIGIPLKPQPYFAHFFHLHSNFTGRTNELKALCDWFNDNKDSVIVLNAIGGMGKSSLAWYWLKECVNSSSIEGIIWWSFYEGESSFTKFLSDAIIYLSGKEIDPGDIGSNYEKTRILINLLGESKFLLILDGFERQLGTYEDQRDSYTEEDIAEARACIDPNAALFLRDQAASFSNSKILITSRIKIRDLEDETGKPLEGCREEELRSFKEDDAYVFMQSQGVKGTRSEILSACEPYRCHPLSLRLLSGLIMRDLRNPGDILVAPRYDVYSDLKARRHHIMEVAFNSLPEKLKKLLSNAAAFRSTITYEALLKFNDYEHEQEFEEGLKELIDFGLILFNKNDGRFDIHPIVRKYAYQRLANKESIHLKLRDYFTMNIPQTKKTQSIEEIGPIIEIYYHSAKAGLSDEAYNLYRNRLSKLLFFRFGAYQTIIVLLQLLFENPTDNVPNLKNYKAQISAMNDLAGAYDRMGHARQAVNILENVFKIIKEKGDIAPVNYRLNFFSSLITLGELRRAEREVRIPKKRNAVDTISAFSRIESSYLLSIKGQFPRAAFELKEAIKIFSKLNNLQGLCVAYNYRARMCLLMERYEDAYIAASKSLELWEKNSHKENPNEVDFIRSNWLTGLALTYKASEATINRDILLVNAESYLIEALLHCRNINLAVLEPDILLSWARWYYLMGNAERAKEVASDALFIAGRYEYRLNLADIHNFLAMIALKSNKKEIALHHSKLASEYALCDGKPYCYAPALEASEKQNEFYIKAELK